jgi:hypothetical protein
MAVAATLRRFIKRDAESSGLDPVKAAQAEFTCTPTEVIYGAWLELESRKTEAWWQSIEKTIDGEIVRAALAKGGDA